MREAIRGHQRQSEVIRGNQSLLGRTHLMREAIRGHQRQSEVIRGNQSLLGRTHVEETRVTRREAEGSARSPFIPDEGGTQRSSAVISGHSWSKSGGIRSESIHTRTPSRHQWSSVVISDPFTPVHRHVISGHQSSSVVHSHPYAVTSSQPSVMPSTSTSR
jgi:hypothetical protein